MGSAELLLATSGADPRNVLMFSAVFVFSCYVVWRVLLAPYVQFEEHRLVVGNAYCVHRIPYARIAGVTGVLGLGVEVAGRGRVPVSAFDTSLWGRPQREAVRAEIVRREAAASVSRELTYEKEYTLGLPEVLGPTVAFLLFLLGAPGLPWTR